MFVRCDGEPVAGSGPHRPGHPGHVESPYFDTNRMAIGFSGCADCLSRCRGVLPVALLSAEATMVAVAFFIEGVVPSPVMTLYQSHWRRVISCYFTFEEAARFMSVQEDPREDHQSGAPRYAFVLEDTATAEIGSGGGNRLVPATGAFADILGRQPGRASFDPVAVYVGLHDLLREIDVETAMADERRALVQASEQALRQEALRQEQQAFAPAFAPDFAQAVAQAVAQAFAPAEHVTEEGSDSSDENEFWIEKSGTVDGTVGGTVDGTVGSSSGTVGSTIGGSGRDRRGEFWIEKSQSTQNPV